MWGMRVASDGDYLVHSNVAHPIHCFDEMAVDQVMKNLAYWILQRVVDQTEERSARADMRMGDVQLMEGDLAQKVAADERAAER